MGNSSNVDEFTDMIREGFVEQMQQVNQEMLKVQEFITVVTTWINENF